MPKHACMLMVYIYIYIYIYIYTYIQSLPKRLSCANIYKYINTDHVISTVCTNFNRNGSGSMLKFW